MLEHLNPQNIENYRRKTMSPGDLLAADEHLASCDECLKQILKSESTESVFSAFAENLTFKAIETDHLPYEQIADYIDGKLDDVEKEIADVHLSACKVCEEDLKALTPFKGTGQTKVEKKTFLPVWIKRGLAFSPEIPLFSQPISQFAGGALVLLIFGES